MPQGVGDTNQNSTDIDFALYPYWDGNLYVFENGVNRGSFGAYAAGDTLRVAVEGGVVKYRRNGTLVYTSTVAPTYPLLQDRNNNILGGGVRDYLEREIPKRDTTLTIIKTTAAQDAAAEATLINIAKTRPMLASDVTIAADNLLDTGKRGAGCSAYSPVAGSPWWYSSHNDADEN